MRFVAIGVFSALCCVVLHDDAIAAPRDYPVPTESAPVPKPGGPFELAYRLGGTPRVGTAIDIEVSVRGESLEAPRLEVATDGGALAVVAQSAVRASAGGFRWSLTVIPLVPAVGYATVVITARIDGVEQSRSVVVPIRTSAESRASAEEAPMTSGGERLILLPAEESVTPR